MKYQVCYDSNVNELLLANAGHEPPIILNKDNEFSNFNESGPPLGIVSNTTYKEYKIKFEKSSMYIFTDGITEIKNAKGEELGSKGFQQYITKFKDKPKGAQQKDLDSLLTDNEIGMSIHYTLERWRKAQNFTFRLGKERLTFTEYDNVTLVTIPFKGKLLLVSTEPRIHYDPIIEKVNSILTDWEKM